MKDFILLLVLLTTFPCLSQDLTGNQLLEKAIQYHDPFGNWESFKGTLFVTMESPKSSNRESEIKIDLANQFFSVKTKTVGDTSEYVITKDSLQIIFNGDKKPSKEILKKHKLSKERAILYQNYYTYLYGLPMKLKDQGTIIHDTIERKKFQQKEYLVLKVTYNKEVGKDTWYFYFNPKTYAMEVYQFFKDKKDSGEYILLSEEESINNIKMPKNRAWYYNKDNGYLGTDVLSKE
jgi:hypothetical protein